MIFVIRHGETALNAARVFQPEDTPLSERGLRQAALLGARLRALGVGRVVSSHLPRARMTAEAIVDGTGLSVSTLELLQERNFGALRGRPYAEVGPEVFARDYVPDRGEGWEAFERRVALAWDAVLELHDDGGNLAVVTHGLVCRALAQQFFELPEGQQVPARFGNTSLTVVEPVAPHKASVVACVAHLGGTAADDEAAPTL
ncbi:MAG: histidine phosphatase family protein [Myxococcales bacterium]